MNRQEPTWKQLGLPKPIPPPYDPKESLRRILEPFGFLKSVIKNYEE